jgi:Protein of unknown function (DUF3592)
VAASGQMATCPHCGAEYPPSPILTTCAKCGGALGEAAPTIDLPPAPDLSAVPPPETFAPVAEGAPQRPTRPEEPPFVLATWPRAVPLGLRLTVLFGGAFSQFGWLFLGFGMIFVWGFGSFADFGPLKVWSGPWRPAEGVITGSRALNMTVNDRRVYGHTYLFVTPDGRQHAGESKATGGTLELGRAVAIEYRERDPSVSRIRGLGGGAVPLWVLGFILIFPGVGLGFLVPGLARGVKANHLLAQGQVGEATQKSMRPTNTRINNQMVYELTFEFVADNGGTYHVKTRTERPERLQDQRQEPVLYDRLSPACAVMRDGLPAEVRVGPSGQLESPPLRRVLAALAIPAITLIGHGTYIALRFFV